MGSCNSCRASGGLLPIAWAALCIALSGCAAISPVVGPAVPAPAAPIKVVPDGTERVVDVAATGIAGVKLSSESGKWIATTDRDGYFRLPQLRPGQVLQDVLISKPGFVSRASCNFRREIDGRYVVLYDLPTASTELHHLGRITGIVRGPDGRPLGGAPLQIDVTERYGLMWNNQPNAAQAITNEAGEFSINDAPPGNLVIRYPLDFDGCWNNRLDFQHWTKPGQKHLDLPVKGICSVARVHVQDGQTQNDVLIDLSKCVGVVEGRVVDDSGHPMKGVMVGLYLKENYVYPTTDGWVGSGFAGFAMPGSDGKERTDANGHYRLVNLPVGSWSIATRSQISVDVEIPANGAVVQAPDLMIGGN